MHALLAAHVNTITPSMPCKQQTSAASMPYAPGLTRQQPDVNCKQGRRRAARTRICLGASNSQSSYRLPLAASSLSILIRYVLLGIRCSVYLRGPCIND